MLVCCRWADVLHFLDMCYILNPCAGIVLKCPTLKTSLFIILFLTKNFFAFDLSDYSIKDSCQEIRAMSLRSQSEVGNSAGAEM